MNYDKKITCVDMLRMVVSLPFRLVAALFITYVFMLVLVFDIAASIFIRMNFEKDFIIYNKLIHKIFNFDYYYN